MNRAERIANQLGMPQGTANHKLRKQILFKYVVKAGDNFCHKCGEEIETCDELSIEHKVPWERRDSDLFWDLDNIAFSHIKCNRPQGFTYNEQSSLKLRKQGPEGTAWCNHCKSFLPLDHFSKNASTWNGIQNRCTSCRSKLRK